MSRIPQLTQKVRPCLRATACSELSHRLAGSSAFTTPPHSGQWLTGASRRRWFMFSQAVPKRVLLVSVTLLVRQQSDQLEGDDVRCERRPA